MDKTCFCGISEYCGYQVETDMKQHDKVIYEDGYNKAVEDFREYLKTVIPCEMPQDIWNLGVDNTCNKMLKR